MDNANSLNANAFRAAREEISTQMQELSKSCKENFSISSRLDTLNYIIFIILFVFLCYCIEQKIDYYYNFNYFLYKIGIFKKLGEEDEFSKPHYNESLVNEIINTIYNLETKISTYENTEPLPEFDTIQDDVVNYITYINDNEDTIKFYCNDKNKKNIDKYNYITQNKIPVKELIEHVTIYNNMVNSFNTNYQQYNISMNEIACSDPVLYTATSINTNIINETE